MISIVQPSGVPGEGAPVETFYVDGIKGKRFADGRVTIDGLNRDILVYPRFSTRILALNLMRSSNFEEKEKTFVLSITDRCNIKCDFCCHPFMNSAIEPEDAIRLTSEAAKLNYDEICCTGGEPFLMKQTLFELARICKANDKLFGVITNAYWAKDRVRAYQLAKDMVEAGFSRITVSWDQSHGEFVSASTAQNAIDACMDAGLKVCLTGSFKKLDDMHANYGIDVSQYEPYENFSLYSFPVISAGMAEENNVNFERRTTSLANLPEDDPLLCTIAYKRETVVYARNGITQPCCSIVGGYKMATMSIADWRENSVADIDMLQNGDPFNRIINVKGFRFLYEIIRQRDPDLFGQLPQIKGCDSVCHLCAKLMTPELGKRLREICEDYVVESIVKELEGRRYSVGGQAQAHPAFFVQITS